MSQFFENSQREDEIKCSLNHIFGSVQTYTEQPPSGSARYDSFVVAKHWGLAIGVAIVDGLPPLASEGEEAKGILANFVACHRENLEHAIVHSLNLETAMVAAARATVESYEKENDYSLGVPSKNQKPRCNVTAVGIESGGGNDTLKANFFGTGIVISPRGVQTNRTSLHERMDDAWKKMWLPRLAQGENEVPQNYAARCAKAWNSFCGVYIEEYANEKNSDWNLLMPHEIHRLRPQEYDLGALKDGDCILVGSDGFASLYADVTRSMAQTEFLDLARQEITRSGGLARLVTEMKKKRDKAYKPVAMLDVMAEHGILLPDGDAAASLAGGDISVLAMIVKRQPSWRMVKNVCLRDNAANNEDIVWGDPREIMGNNYKHIFGLSARRGEIPAPQKQRVQPVEVSRAFQADELETNRDVDVGANIPHPALLPSAPRVELRRAFSTVAMVTVSGFLFAL